MGDIISGIIGGVGSLIGGNKQAKSQKYAADKAAETARLGFDWLRTNPEFMSYLTQGSKANNLIGSLLTGGPGAEDAFNTYKNSTGYAGRLAEGTDAITGNQAARGLLNSGATLKGINKFGQQFASGEFANYLAQLGALSGAGLSAGTSIGSAGSSAGASGAAAIGQGYGAAANASAQGLNNALGNFGFAANAAYDRWGPKGNSGGSWIW